MSSSSSDSSIAEEVQAPVRGSEDTGKPTIASSVTFERHGSVPSPEDLYGASRPQLHSTEAAKAEPWASDLSDCEPFDSGVVAKKHRKSRAEGDDHHHRSSDRRSRSRRKKSGSKGKRETKCKGDTTDTTSVDSQDDSLLRRMRHQEKEFDSKIKEINQTFYHAGHQLVIRDEVIEALQAEILRLRQELSRTAVAPADLSQHRAREVTLTQQLKSTEEHHRVEYQRLISENAELKEKLRTCEAMRAKSQGTVDELMKQLGDSDKATRDLTRKHKAQLDKVKSETHERLIEVEKQFKKLEHRYTQAQCDRDALEKDQGRSQAKLLKMQMRLSEHRDQESNIVQRTMQEKEKALEEVEAVRLGMARLIHILSCVPGMQDYLQWNELDDQFVFAGYPTRYFTSNNTGESRRGNRNTLNNENNSDDNDEDDDQYGPVQSALAGSGETGLADGVYGGRTTYADSKNIYLNGQWIQQLQDIVRTQNLFMKLKKIKLFELDEAAQLSEQLPSANDVLTCRKKDNDYWVPYAVFVEAQKFKNKYYPKVPALSHFYPFLLRLNKIWNAKMQDRLGVLKKEMQQTQQQLAALKRSQAQAFRGSSHTGDVTGTSYRSSPGVSPQRIRKRVTSQAERRRALLGAPRSIAELQCEHQRLRREVRLQISSQRCLQVLGKYDELVHALVGGMQKLCEMCEDLETGEVSSSAPHDTRHGGRQPSRRRPPWEEKGHHSDFSHDGSADHDDYDDMKYDEVAPLPTAPRPRPQKSRRTHTPTNSHNASDRENADEDSEEAIERLLCIVQHTCERVCEVAEQLTVRTSASCEDAVRVMQMLDSHVAQNASFLSDSSADGGSQLKQSQSTQHALRAKYGQGGATTSVAPISGVQNVVHSVMDSVKDFAQLMQDEVRQAQQALQTISSEAMADAESC